MIAQARLATIANKIYNEFLAAHISNAIISEELAYNFEEELRKWKASLPGYFVDTNSPAWFRGPRAVILWKEQNLRMMLWRGGQRSNRARPRDGVAMQNCVLTAMESVQAICGFCTANDRLHQGLSWYATYFLFQAVLVLDFGLLQSPDDEQANTWRTSIDKSRECFSQLGITNPAALRCISVLDRIHNHHQSDLSSQLGYNVAEVGTDVFPDFGTMELPGDNMDYSSHQAYMADPALQFFLDGAPMTNLFDGVYGFPSTQEQQNFDYIPGDFYGIDDFDMSLNWNDNQP
jgi:transcriptional regulatory protein GAL4